MCVLAGGTGGSSSFARHVACRDRDVLILHDPVARFVRSRWGYPPLMPPETPEQSARVDRRIRLGCLAIPLLGMAFLAALAVWGLITNGHLSTRGWIYIICFLVLIPAAIRIFRRGRSRSS